MNVQQASSLPGKFGIPLAEVEWNSWAAGHNVTLSLLWLCVMFCLEPVLCTHSQEAYMAQHVRYTTDRWYLCAQ